MSLWLYTDTEWRKCNPIKHKCPAVIYRGWSWLLMPWLLSYWPCDVHMQLKCDYHWFRLIRGPFHEHLFHHNSNSIEIFVLLSSQLLSGDCYVLSHMAWQLCCHGMYKIFVAIWYSTMELNYDQIFIKFELQGKHRSLSPSLNKVSSAQHLFQWCATKISLPVIFVNI